MYLECSVRYSTATNTELVSCGRREAIPVPGLADVCTPCLESPVNNCVMNFFVEFCQD